VKEVGKGWDDVVEKCRRGHFQPHLLFYVKEKKEKEEGKKEEKEREMLKILKRLYVLVSKPPVPMTVDFYNKMEKIIDVMPGLMKDPDNSQEIRDRASVNLKAAKAVMKV